MSEIKVPIGFWIIATIALLWNLAGVSVFVMQVTMTPEALAELPEADQKMYANTPAWSLIAFGAAVIGGTLGCIGLLLRKRWALILFIISLLGVIGQMLDYFVIREVTQETSMGGLIMTIMIPVVALFLIWFSLFSKNKSWLS